MSMSCRYREDLENIVLVMLEQGTKADEIKSEVEYICESFEDAKQQIDRG